MMIRMSSSTQNGETPLHRKIVQRGLHDRTHMCVDLLHVGVLTELCLDVDGFEDLRDDLVGSGRLSGINVSPNGNPNEIGKMSVRIRSFISSSFATHIPRFR
jgi:hypothetical protein